MGFRVGVCFLVLGFLAQPASAKCEDGLLDSIRAKAAGAMAVLPFFRWQSPKITTVEVETPHPRLRNVIPDYDDEKDIVFAFRADGHVSLYIGPGYWDTYHVDPQWNISYSFREDFQQAYPGVFVRVRVGRRWVESLLTAARAGHYSRLGRMGCHHSQLYFMQRVGILVRGGLPLLGSSTYERATKNGFVSVDGQRFEHDVFVIQQPGRRVADEIRVALFGANIGGIGRALGLMGLSVEQFGSLLIARGLGGEVDFLENARYGRVEWTEENIRRAVDDSNKVEALLLSEYKDKFDRAFENWESVLTDPEQYLAAP